MRILVISNMEDFHWTHGGGQADLQLSYGV